MSNFDLNIGNYKTDELEDLFNLKAATYTTYDIETQENILRQSLLTNYSIDPQTKSKMQEFYRAIKHKLIQTAIVAPTVVQPMWNNQHDIKPADTLNAGDTFLIPHIAAQKSNTMPSDVYADARSLNPLTRRILKKTLNIDTRFRTPYDSTTSSNFHVDLPIRFENVVSLRLSALELPTTFYNISASYGNNKFEINGCLVMLSDGNYTQSDVIDAINAEFVRLELVGFVASRASNTGKVTIIAPTDITILFLENGDKQPQTATLGWTLGFRKSTYEHAMIYESESAFDIIGSRYLFFVVDDYNNNINNGFYGAFSESLLNDNILTRIPLLPQSSALQPQQPQQTREYFGGVDIQKLKIQLLDEFGRIFEIKDDYSFCLQFDVIHDL